MDFKKPNEILTVVLRLYTAYYKALQKAAGVNPNTPVTLLDRELGIPSIDNFNKILLQRLLYKSTVFTKLDPLGSVHRQLV